MPIGVTLLNLTSVYFADSSADITPQADNGNLRNGELWYDTAEPYSCLSGTIMRG